MKTNLIRNLGAIVAVASAGFLATSSASASDYEGNACILDPVPESANISLPLDDQFHYPSQWTGDPGKVNDGPGALETQWTAYKWQAYPRGGGDPIPVEGSVLLAGANIPSPFLGGEMGWVRISVMAMLVDGQFIDYVYFAPGEFAPSVGGVELSVGGPEDYVLEVTNTGMVPVDPSVQIGDLVSYNGSEDALYGASDGLQIAVHNESVSAPMYPWDDGYDPLWGYYWIRPRFDSNGTMTYNGQVYDLYGQAWVEREWQFYVPELQQIYMERHVGIQIDGCVNPQGKVVKCQHAGRNILAFDVRDRNTGEKLIHEWQEQGPAPRCLEHELSEVDDWDFIPLEFYTNPMGIDFATKVRLVSPSRGVDLVITAVTNDQHIKKVHALFPGWYEGAATVEGTIDGRPVVGSSLLEAFNIPNGSWQQ